MTASELLSIRKSGGVISVRHDRRPWWLVITLNRVERSGWLLRLGVVIISGALLVTAVTIGIAPRLWRIANAHSEEPVALPDFIPLSQRSYVYDAAGNEIAVYELENSQPISFADIPAHVVQAFVAVEDN